MLDKILFVNYSKFNGDSHGRRVSRLLSRVPNIQWLMGNLESKAQAWLPEINLRISKAMETLHLLLGILLVAELGAK